MRYLTLLMFALMLCPSLTHGEISTIALSASNAPGIANSKFLSFGLPSLNASGVAVLSVTLETGPGSVTAGDDGAVYKIDPNNWTLVAREGANAPHVAGATFSSFSSVAIDAAGNVQLRGEMLQGGAITANNNHAIWRYSNVGNSLRHCR